MMSSNFICNTFSFVLHSTVAALYVMTIRHDATLFLDKEHAKLGFPFDITYGGRLKLLTFINAHVQALFFALYAVVILTRIRKLSDLCNFLYTRIVFPFGMHVSVVFWTLYYIDRSLIYPEVLDSIFSWQQNHVLHTLPALSLLVHNFLEEHRYPKSLVRGVSVTILASLAYLGWVFHIANESGKWVYAILGFMEPPIYRAIFCAGMVTLAVVFYTLGDCINSIIYTRKQPIVAAKVKKTKSNDNKESINGTATLKRSARVAEKDKDK